MQTDLDKPNDKPSMSGRASVEQQVQARRASESLGLQRATPTRFPKVHRLNPRRTKESPFQGAGDLPIVQSSLQPQDSTDGKPQWQTVTRREKQDGGGDPARGNEKVCNHPVASDDATT